MILAIRRARFGFACALEAAFVARAARHSLVAAESRSFHKSLRGLPPG